jgi:uncharacterized DUF497 family protein
LDTPFVGYDLDGGMLAGLERRVTWDLGCFLAAPCVATKCQHGVGAWVKFEWDGNKRDVNLQKHGLDFVRASDLFEGPLAVEESKEMSVEKRWVATGFLGDIAVSVVFTRRGDVIRIISMRRARRNERARYQALYGH